jgi:hypothetical protein
MRGTRRIGCVTFVLRNVPVWFRFDPRWLVFTRPLTFLRLAPALFILAGTGCDRQKASNPVRLPLYVLVDAEQRAAENPQTFEIPSRQKRQACKPGDRVKIILEVPPGAPKRGHGGERPWLIIQEVRQGPRYLGKLDNDLVVFTELKNDEPIEFGPEHIIQLWEDRVGK